MTCIKNFLDKDPNLTVVVIQNLLKFWPITAPAKEIVFIGEIEDLFEFKPTVCKKGYSAFGEELIKRLSSTIRS